METIQDHAPALHALVEGAGLEVALFSLTETRGSLGDAYGDIQEFPRGLFRTLDAAIDAARDLATARQAALDARCQCDDELYCPNDHDSSLGREWQHFIIQAWDDDVHLATIESGAAISWERPNGTAGLHMMNLANKPNKENSCN